MKKNLIDRNNIDISFLGLLMYNGWLPFGMDLKLYPKLHVERSLILLKVF